jgi:tRNA 2-thiouridine synthesizing protein E
MNVARSPESPPVNSEGFLCAVNDWTPATAEWLASHEGIELTAAHWEVLHLLREYYASYDSSPAMRALVKYVRLKLGEEKGRSIYLLKLFPGSPAKIGSKLAGLPKPANCL